MTNLFNNFFLITYRLYKKWDNIDPFFNTCFTIAAICGTTIYLLNTLLYIVTRWELFHYRLDRFFIVTGITIALVLLHYYGKKTHLIQLYNQNKKEKIHPAYKIILSIMFSTWFILGYVIKMSLTGNR
ncbi:hypothetical protein SAMN04488018_13129 [Myroides marinus]|uniref:Uncharacterized protein n=1 Tax=Myroides marinus TaxID=703342 RepID=A0A1H6YD50_9FLAO|nr:hypothetical protein AS361_04480 [Myroides marinus]SEJ39181.1 hypothetical protein SAMN04488018_13129 [Myroides marinus]